MNALAVARNKKLNFASTCQNMVAKRNLVPPLRALQSVRASSTAFALSAELRLALRYKLLCFFIFISRLVDKTPLVESKINSSKLRVTSYKEKTKTCNMELVTCNH